MDDNLLSDQLDATSGYSYLPSDVGASEATLTASDITPVASYDTSSVYSAPASSSPFTAGTQILNGLGSIVNSVGNIIGATNSPGYVPTYIAAPVGPGTSTNPLGTQISSALGSAVGSVTSLLPIIVIGAIALVVLKLFKK